MLHVNVGLSRKLTRDYNSTGFSVNLEGEVAVPLDDPEGIIEKVREYYDLADEALRDQIERYESDSAIASRDEVPQSVPPERRSNTGPANGSRGNGNGRGNGHQRPAASNGGSGNTGGRPDEPATNKQVQFLLTISKRHRLSNEQLEHRIAGIIGRTCGVYDLTKREAGLVLDDLTNSEAAGNGRR